MNRNNVIVTIIVVIIAIAGISYFVMNKDTAPTTTNVNTNIEQVPSNNNTPATNKEPGVPSVTTKAPTYRSQSTAVLDGSINPNGVQTSYWYEYGLTNALGSMSPQQLIGGGYLTYPAPALISGLSSNTNYYFRIAGQNQYGKVYGGIETFKTTTTPPIVYVPPKAETKNASNIGQTFSTLNGTTTPNGVMTFYWFEYGISPGLGSTTAVNSAGAGTSSLPVSASISGLLPNTTYYFRFNAQNGYGTVNGNILSFTTNPVNPLPAQSNMPTSTTDSASSISKNGATLNGQVNPNGSPATYYFEYGKATLFGLFSLDQKTNTKSLSSGIASVSVSSNVSGLDADSTYYYRLVSTNPNGTSNGGIFSFTTKK